jgi:hypothetical protein
VSDDERNPQIRIDRIPVKGGAGAVLVIVALLSVMLIELPELRWPALLGLIGGGVVGCVLILWHRSRRR